ncbi:MAG: NDP-sugar synthase [Candidatus Nanopelagicales bacterium]|nr:NDP-sugar synthase [Candidatus Nanopelagicales bacterium]MCF8550654.1 NDP-sugar synthase [Candidatus Nanopelagicales bacterium]
MREAILLVGGQGTRLRPLTINTPKPMLPVAGVPFTVHQILRARDAGVTRIVLATSYKAEVFAEFLSDSELGAADSGIDVVIATEEVPLGTGGAIRYASSYLESGPNDPVLIFNGDVLTGLDIDALVTHHRNTDSDVTLYLTRVADPRAYGLVPTDPAGRVLQFLEKPQTPEEIVTDQINAGCYVFTRSVIDQIPEGRPVSVERETFPELLAQSRLVSGVVDPGYWLDLGTPLAFVQGSVDLVRGIAPSPAVKAPGESLLLAGAQVDSSARISGGTTLGVGVIVGAETDVDGSVVFDSAEIGSGCVIRNSIIGEGAVIGDRCVIDGAVIGDHSRIGADNELREGVRVWVDTELPELSVRFSSDQ